MHGSPGGRHPPLRGTLLWLKHGVGVPVVDALGSSKDHGDDVVAGRNVSIGVLNVVERVLPRFLSSLIDFTTGRECDDSCDVAAVKTRLFLCFEVLISWQ